MATNNWSVLCMFILTDSQTNSVSYINALESLGAPEFPVLLPPGAAIGTMWQRMSDGEETVTIRIKLLNPRGSEQILITSTFTMSQPRHRLNIGLLNVTLEQPGMYQFIVEQQVSGAWQQVSNLPLDAVLLPAITPQTQIETA
ncbi:MAG: DUF6941 family protein [Syntrophobacteraceae bacterium]